MEVIVTRESTCMGDDMHAPHTKTFHISENWDWQQLIEEAARIALPTNVEGGRATWVLASNILLAVHAQEWFEGKLVMQMDDEYHLLDWHHEKLKVHWSYLAGHDPDLAYEILREVRLRGPNA